MVPNSRSMIGPLAATIIAAAPNAATSKAEAQPFTPPAGGTLEIKQSRPQGGDTWIYKMPDGSYRKVTTNRNGDIEKYIRIKSSAATTPARTVTIPVYYLPAKKSVTGGVGMSPNIVFSKPASSNVAPVGSGTKK